MKRLHVFRGLPPRQRRRRIVYGVVSAFLLVTSLGAGYFVSDVIQSRAMDRSNQALLRQNIDQIESQLKALDNTCLVFMLNNISLTRFMDDGYAQLAAKDQYAITKDLRDRLTDIKGAHPEIHTIFLLSERNGLALSAEGCQKSEQLAQRLNADLPAVLPRNASYVQRVIASPQLNGGLDQATLTGCVVLLRTYPAETPHVRYGAIAAFINESSIINTLGQALSGGPEQAAILMEEEGYLCAAREKASTSDEVSMRQTLEEMRTEDLSIKVQGDTVTYMLQSSYTNWYYMLQVPKNAGTNVVRTIRNLFLACLGAYTLLIAGTSYLSNRNAYGSLDKVARSLRKYTQDFINREDLVSAVETMALDNESLRNELDSYKPMAARLMLIDLLCPGRVADFGAHLDGLARDGIPLYRNGFAIAVVQGNRQYLEGALQKIHDVDVRMVSIQLDGQEQVVLCSFSKEDAKINLGLMHRLLGYLAQAEEIVRIGVGRVYLSCDGIASSYREAQQAIRYRLFYKGEKLLFIHDLQEGVGFNPSQTEAQVRGIIGALKSEDKTTMFAKIETAIRGYIAEKMDIRLFHATLYHIVMQGLEAAVDLGVGTKALLDEASLARFPHRLETCETVDAVIELVQEVFERIYQQIELRRGSRNLMTLGARAVQLVNDRHTDSEFSMMQLAEALGISDSYVRRVFREYAAMSFQEYLTMIRMEHAKTLLRSTNLSVSAIAQRVGYQSDNSFIRAFRQRHGVPPGIWRQNPEPNQKNELSP